MDNFATPGNSIDEKLRPHSKRPWAVLRAPLKSGSRAQENFSLTVESFAKWVKRYLDSQGPSRRIMFLVDEVGSLSATTPIVWLPKSSDDHRAAGGRFARAGLGWW